MTHNRTYFLFVIALSLACQVVFAQSPIDWLEVSKSSPPDQTSRFATPSQFHLVQLNSISQFTDRLARAPQRGDRQAESLIILLPNEKGMMADYQIVESSIMETALQEKFPAIRSYTLIGVSNSHAFGKLSINAENINAMIFLPGESAIFIDPYRLDSQTYMAYRKSDYPHPKEKFVCHTTSRPNEALNRLRTGDCQLRQYRLALACTGEYATFHGGTVTGAMNAFNTSMTRVNGVFEKEAGISMILVTNNNNLIYLNAGTDPYSNSNGGAMLNQNQITCDNVIMTANYDIGHVFSTGGGGIAQLRSPCDNAGKAQGVTGSSSPMGDPFDIDFVAHEMGHQFGGNHTQNNDCNRSSKSYEPGSASTIMGYAGICSPNVQSNSDDYYHAASLAEFSAFVTNGTTGGSCDAITSSANTPPTANAGSDWTVPISTPFVLTGTGSDPDSDPITYCWEQYNNDVATMPPSSTSTVGPNFRSLIPSTSPTREFPKDGLANTWEVLPSVGRIMDFRLTVRDFNATYGYGCTEEDDMEVTFHAGAGPFQVTAADGGETWLAGGTETVTWSVANTHLSPVSCATVNILLSTDAGATYPTTIASGVANSGSYSASIPNITTSQAKIKIQAADNIFFDISDDVFSIGPDITCVTVMSTDVPVTIDPNTVATYFSDLIITDTFTIQSVEVVNLVGTHSYISDMSFTLVHPTSTEVPLLSGQCTSQDDFNMGFIDGGASISCPISQGHIYDPSSPLTAFNTTAMNGTWRMKMSDNVTEDGGSLSSWGLKICYLTPAAGPCDVNLVFDNGSIATGNYYATQSILASVAVDASAIVLFQAGEVNLASEFLVPLGAELEARIGGCQ